MAQNLLHHRRLLDRCYQAQPPTTVTTSENIKQENSAEKVSPGEMAGAGVGGSGGRRNTLRSRHCVVGSRLFPGVGPRELPE